MVALWGFLEDELPVGARASEAMEQEEGLALSAEFAIHLHLVQALGPGDGRTGAHSTIPTALDSP